jgi:DNA-binding transcriptional ArsR family regulator
MNEGRGSFISAMIETPITDILQALGDPARLEIVRGLVDDEPRTCGTFGYLGLSPSTLSHHFKVLRGAGLIETESVGPRRLNRLRRRELDEAFPGLLDAVLAGR